MADVKAVRTEFFFSLEQSEFNLVFRAVGKACGVKASFKTTELETLRKLNLKLANIRLATTRTAMEQAQAAQISAQELLTQEFPPEEID